MGLRPNQMQSNGQFTETCMEKKWGSLFEDNLSARAITNQAPVSCGNWAWWSQGRKGPKWWWGLEAEPGICSPEAKGNSNKWPTLNLPHLQTRISAWHLLNSRIESNWKIHTIVTSRLSPLYTQWRNDATGAPATPGGAVSRGRQIVIKCGTISQD